LIAPTQPSVSESASGPSKRSRSDRRGGSG
jgi:hypothetical protein